MKRFAIGFTAFLLSFAALAAETGVVARAVIVKAENDCKYEQGKFRMESSALSRHDLSGDGRPDEIIDTAKFSCSTAASLWGGTGGTYLYAVVNGKSHEFLAHAWRVVDVNKQKVLLLAVHHSECGGTGPCFRAHVWAENGFRTTRP